MVHLKAIFPNYLSCLAGLMTLLSCNSSNPDTEKNPAPFDSTGIKTSTQVSNPVLQDRLMILGDFDGDGQQDSLRESYLNQQGKESVKLFDGSNQDNQIEKVTANKGICRLLGYFGNHKSDSFLVTKDPRQTGLIWLSNEGNLDSVPGDEIAYVIDWADYSGMNTCFVMSWRPKKGWTNILSFTINENIQLENDQLYEGGHLLKSLGTGKVKYKYWSQEAELKEREAIIQ